jgi:acetoacetate decarboxylase
MAVMSLISFFLVGPLRGPAYGQGNMYEEFDGVMLFYTPKDTTTYRELLPQVFDLPDQPLVEVFDIDYYKMAPWSLEPYREVAIFLLAKYKGEEIWHCITMPVTTDKARIGGITYLGYPKVLAEVNFVRQSPVFSGNLKVDGKTILELTLDTKDRTATDKEREWFKRLTGIPSLNFLKGKLIDPVPAARNAKTNMLELSEKFPQTFKVQVGRATLIGYPEAAPKANDWRPKAFGIEVKEIVLAYYFQNKYGFSFGRVKEISD